MKKKNIMTVIKVLGMDIKVGEIFREILQIKTGLLFSTLTQVMDMIQDVSIVYSVITVLLLYNNNCFILIFLCLHLDFSGIWTDTESFGSKDESLSKDYKDFEAWQQPFKCLAITRHNDEGIVDGYKVWEMDTNSSFDAYFNPTVSGRRFVTSNGPIQRSIASGATNIDTDPILASDGPDNNLAFNWVYSNNGARVVQTDVGKFSGTLSAADSNDDDTHGIGNTFGGAEWTHDASILQPDCHGAGCAVQGSDYGSSEYI